MRIATVLPGYPLSGECWVLDELTVESIAERTGIPAKKLTLEGDTILVAGRPFATISDAPDIPEKLVGAWTTEDRVRVRAEATSTLERRAARIALSPDLASGEKG